MINYYQKLLDKGRLVPILDNKNKTIGAFSFYIINNENKYLRSENFKVIEEYINGSICFIDHLFNDKVCHANIAHGIFTNIIKMIRDKFPQVEFIKWCRYKDGNRFVFTKYIGGQHVSDPSIRRQRI